jgi:hypothetical protein
MVYLVADIEHFSRNASFHPDIRLDIRYAPLPDIRYTWPINIWCIPLKIIL